LEVELFLFVNMSHTWLVNWDGVGEGHVRVWHASAMKAGLVRARIEEEAKNALESKRPDSIGQSSKQEGK